MRISICWHQQDKPNHMNSWNSEEQLHISIDVFKSMICQSISQSRIVSTEMQLKQHKNHRIPNQSKNYQNSSSINKKRNSLQSVSIPAMIYLDQMLSWSSPGEQDSWSSQCPSSFKSHGNSHTKLKLYKRSMKIEKKKMNCKHKNNRIKHQKQPPNSTTWPCHNNS